MCTTYFEAPALCVRLPCARAVLPLCMNVSYYVYQYAVLSLHSPWGSRACVQDGSVLEPLNPHLGSVIEP